MCCAEEVCTESVAEGRMVAEDGGHVGVCAENVIQSEERIYMTIFWGWLAALSVGYLVLVSEGEEVV